MEPKPIPKSIDADILQCKADVMRARNAAMAAQKGKLSAGGQDPQGRPPSEAEVRPQGPDEGVQVLLQMAAEQQEPLRPGAGSSVRPSPPLPAALRPLEQVRVGNVPAIPAAFPPPSQPAPTAANVPPAKPAPNLEPPSDATPKKLRIPRFDEIVSWGKRILEDRPKSESASDKAAAVQSAEMDRLIQDLSQIRLAKQALDSQVMGLQTELASMTHSLGRARDQLRDNADTAERLYDQIDHLQKKTDEQVLQISDLKDQLSKKQSELEEAVRNLQDSNQIQAQSQEQIQSLQNQLAARNKDLVDLQSQLKQVQATLEQTQTRLLEEVKFRNEIQSSTDQMAQLGQRLQETQAARDQVGQQLADSEKAIAEIRSQLEARQQELTWFRDELKTSQQLADQRQEQIDAFSKVADERAAAQQLADERMTQIGQLQGQRDELQQRIEPLEKEVQRLQTELAVNQDSCGKQAQQLEDARLESKRLHEQIQVHLAAQSAIETELAQTRQEAIEGEGLRRTLQEQSQNLTGLLEAATKELQESRAGLDEVKEQWAQSQIQSRKIQEESDRLREDLATARQELESLRVELADLGSRQHGLQEQLQMESFLAEDLEPESNFPSLAEPSLDVSQLETDMDRRLEPEGRMEWMQIPGHPSANTANGDIADKDSSIPQFNLADQILAEQRKISARRRQRSGESSRGADRSNGPRGIGHVVQSLSPAGPQRPAPVVPLQGKSAEPIVPQPAEMLSPIQREILAEIVAAEINRFCGR